MRGEAMKYEVEQFLDAASACRAIGADSDAAEFESRAARIQSEEG